MAATAAAATKLMMLAFGTWDPSVKLEERQMEASIEPVDSKTGFGLNLRAMQGSKSLVKMDVFQWSWQVKIHYLSALRSTMALSPELLCQSLVSNVLPKLSMASTMEVQLLVPA